MSTSPRENQWFEVSNADEIITPALIIYPGRIESNIREMISMAGGAELIRPHVKTHKMPGVVRLMMQYGINKFKCATIAEAEMVANCGAADILLAMQPVGPNIDRFFALKEKFPEINFSCIVDCEDQIILLWQKAYAKKVETDLWLDINNGMNRTGIVPGEKAFILYNTILSLPLLNARGLHVYDGHIHEKDPALRKQKSDDAFANVTSLIEKLKSNGVTDIRIIAGGTPTFPVHAAREGAETSPGTILLMDYGYSNSYKDLNFLHAAVLITRIVSKPEKDLICLDLGTKAVASEMPQPRVKILSIKNYSIVGHNEEHMIISTPEAEKFKVGDCIYCIPWHICPTVDRFDFVYTAVDNTLTGQWNVEARKRKITI